ncbi:MAG: hypothetical protein ACRDGT_04360 [Candidatus Limnocylindria bacterium]
MRDLFELGPLRAQALHPNEVLSVRQIETTSLARVEVQQRDGVALQYVRRLQSVRLLAEPPFDIRSAFDAWYLSQPELSEIGDPRTRTFGQVDLTYWEIDDWVSDLMGEQIAASREFAELRAPVPIDADLSARLVPRRDLSLAGTTCLATGRYERSVGEIVVFRYTLDPSGRLSAGSREALRHEALHWVQWEVAPQMQRVDWWLREGWAAYISGEEPRHDLLEAHACGSETDLPTIREFASGIASGRSGAARSLLLYAAASSAVEYLYDELGAAETYWDMVRSMSSGTSPADTYMEALGVPLERLHAAWIERVKARYCGGS